MIEIQIPLAKLPGQIKKQCYYDFKDHKIEILIIYLGVSKYKVLSSFCPHFGGKLEYKEDQLVCYFHDYRFDLNTGKCINRNVGSKCSFLDYVLNDKNMIIYLD